MLSVVHVNVLFGFVEMMLKAELNVNSSVLVSSSLLLIKLKS